MPMLPRHLATLEYDKILSLLARHTSFSVAESQVRDLQPLTTESEIKRAQDATAEARYLLEARPNSGVRGAKDIRPHIRRASVGAPLQPGELLDIAMTIATGRSVRNLLERQESRTPTLSRYARDILDLDDLERTIRDAIDDEGRVLDGASDRLRTIRHEIRAAFDRLMRRLNELISSPSVHDALQDATITMRSGRYVLPVKADFKGRVRGIVHDQSSSGATLFIEPIAIVELTNKWKQHGLEEEREIERILLEISGQVSAAQLGLSGTVDALARIDVAFAMSKLAIEMEASRPEIVPFDRTGNVKTAIDLRAARHPLLRGNVVPITMNLGRDFDVLLITGPNTGGKTVGLKTAGLLALMAQTGLQIPAEEGSSITIFSGVYADIGDEQSIEQSLSTFSSHVNRIVEVLRLADRQSLVLLDEVGAGTDPQEGAALSVAILDYLVKTRIFTIATTHSSELKSFAYATPRVENASVEFDLQSLRPTYRLTVGLPGRSNALAIAERLGMPLPIIEKARAQINPSELRADELLAEIHQQLARARDDRSDAARIRLDADRVAQQLRSRLNAAEREREQIVARAQEEVEATVVELRRDAEALRRELRGMRAEREHLAEIEERISGLRGSSPSGPRPTTRGTATTRDETFTVGTTVNLPTWGAAGVIRSLTASGEQAEVEVDGKRIRVATADLVASSPTRSTTPRESAVTAGYLPGYLPGGGSPRRITAEGWSPIESQLDLRGQTTEESRYRLDQYLNDAYMEGLATVRVVHGKGTGAVRQAVRDLLHDHPLVRSHETAEAREGGDGATVVHLAS